jgi:hypothetical protein
MRSVTFKTKIHDGLIKIPDRYKNLETQDIEVILIAANPEVEILKNTTTPGKKAKGILHKYANPALSSQEKTAWEMAVKEKYAHH